MRSAANKIRVGDVCVSVYDAVGYIQICSMLILNETDSIKHPDVPHGGLIVQWYRMDKANVTWVA